ncbi:unnamed protein product [Adineta ricciae]|uniref:Uncharacterized protein n=1 Tax=Adineta ricciae TaxID=249248 RepID=A0A815NLU7_ADIRI|nr:unnamed protein product [Adineta ricciae]CAF1628609.1 unnamed protein product [Adineta ricciae]
MDSTTPAVNGSTVDSTQYGLNDVSKVETQVTNEHSTAPNTHSHRQNTRRYTDLANNLASSTVTLVMERSKPLILKLRNPSHAWAGLGSAIKPQDDIESTINSLGDELVAHVTATVNSIRDEVKSARPQPDEENYELKTAAYQELVKSAAHIINNLTEALDDFFIEYRKLIDQFWDHIQNCANSDVPDSVRQFENQTEKIFRDAVTNKIEPLFKAIDSKLNPSEQ